jgi:hypothetical protein
MQRAMWRKAEKNLDMAGHLQMYKYSPFVVTSSAGGESRPIYEGLCTRLEATAWDIFFLHVWQHSLRIVAPSSS